MTMLQWTPFGSVFNPEDIDIENITGVFKSLPLLARLPDTATVGMLTEGKSLEQVTRDEADREADMLLEDFPGDIDPYAVDWGEDKDALDKAVYQVSNPNSVVTPWGGGFADEELDMIFDEYPAAVSLIDVEPGEDVESLLAEADEVYDLWGTDLDPMLEEAEELAMSQGMDVNEVVVQMADQMLDMADQSTAGMEMAGGPLEAERFAPSQPPLIMPEEPFVDAPPAIPPPSVPGGIDPLLLEQLGPSVGAGMPLPEPSVPGTDPFLVDPAYDVPVPTTAGMEMAGGQMEAQRFAEPMPGDIPGGDIPPWVQAALAQVPDPVPGQVPPLPPEDPYDPGIIDQILALTAKPASAYEGPGGPVPPATPAADSTPGMWDTVTGFLGDVGGNIGGFLGDTLEQYGADIPHPITGQTARMDMELGRMGAELSGLPGRMRRETEETARQLNIMLIREPGYDATPEQVMGQIQEGIDAGDYDPRYVAQWVGSNPGWSQPGNPYHGLWQEYATEPTAATAVTPTPTPTPTPTVTPTTTPTPTVTPDSTQDVGSAYGLTGLVRGEAGRLLEKSFYDAMNATTTRWGTPLSLSVASMPKASDEAEALFWLWEGKNPDVVGASPENIESRYTEFLNKYIPNPHYYTSGAGFDARIQGLSGELTGDDVGHEGFRGGSPEANDARDRRLKTLMKVYGFGRGFGAGDTWANTVMGQAEREGVSMVDVFRTNTPKRVSAPLRGTGMMEPAIPAYSPMPSSVGSPMPRGPEYFSAAAGGHPFGKPGETLRERFPLRFSGRSAAPQLAETLD